MQRGVEGHSSRLIWSDIYDTKGCHEAIARRGVQGSIPTRNKRQTVERAQLWRWAHKALLHATRRLD